MSDNCFSRAFSPLSLRSVQLAGVLILLAIFVPQALAHETDQYTLPPGRQFADVGPVITKQVYDAIHKGVDRANAKIKSAVESHAKPEELQKLQSGEAIADAVNHEFPIALFFIESLDKTMTSDELAAKYPGDIVGYKPFVGVRKNVDIAISPFRAWQCATIKCFGVYMGDDKLGHFSDMGIHYFNAYQSALKKGATEEKAIRAAVSEGTDGPFSEKGILGWATCGDYSNADLVSNYMGFVFYRNLSEPQMLKGVQRPPMVVREGEYFKIAPFVRADSDFFTWYISDHLNEALNPGDYVASIRGGMRKAIVEYRKTNLPRYADANGNPRSPAWFAAKTDELKTYWGFDYGHVGDKELIRLSDAGFAAPPRKSQLTTANADGLLPMHYAAMVGDVEAMQGLIDRGAEAAPRVAVSDSVAAIRGDTPLHLAAREGNLEAVALLLSRGADANARNDRRATPLHMAAEYPEVAAALIAAGADVNAVDTAGRTPLHWVANNAASKSIDVLLAHSANAQARDRDGRTPLHLAAASGHNEATTAILRQKVVVDAPDNFKETPLHLAAAKSAKVTDQLLKAGAAIGARDDFGCTPLRVAAAANQPDVVAVLLAHSADPSAADAYGVTPIIVAKREGFTGVVELLEKPAAPPANAQAADLR